MGQSLRLSSIALMLVLSLGDPIPSGAVTATYSRIADTTEKMPEGFGANDALFTDFSWVSLDGDTVSFLAGTHSAAQVSTAGDPAPSPRYRPSQPGRRWHPHPAAASTPAAPTVARSRVTPVRWPLSAASARAALAV